MLKGPQIRHKGPIANKLVLILHGYGADGDNLFDLARTWAPEFPDVDFLVPSAPYPCERYPQGFQWFGLRDFSVSTIRSGLEEIRPLLINYISSQLAERHLALKDLVVVGFSQGGMIALDLIFALPGLGGVISYAGAFIPPSPVVPPLNPPLVLLVHGVLDQAVPFWALKEAEHTLKSLGVTSEIKEIANLGHAIESQGLRAGSQFLARVFAESPKNDSSGNEKETICHENGSPSSAVETLGGR